MIDIRIRLANDGWRVYIGDLFCPRLAFDDAIALRDQLAAMPDAIQARIRLAKHCVWAGCNS